MKGLFPSLLLLALTACKPLPELPGASSPYAQTDAGLTLVFIDPELKASEQEAQRLQVRVDHITWAEDGSMIVHKELTRGLQQPFKSSLRVSKGGVVLLDEQGRTVSQLLPEGFPDRVGAWENHGTQYTVLGRATWSGASILPAGSDPVGIWVEARPLRGLRSRSLFLKALGEVETVEERPGGQWVCVNRLQQRGFVDAPTSAPTPAPAAAAAAAPKAKSKPKSKSKPAH